jgi:hypothetical protein
MKTKQKIWMVKLDKTITGWTSYDKIEVIALFCNSFYVPPMVFVTIVIIFFLISCWMQFDI